MHVIYVTFDFLFYFIKLLLDYNYLNILKYILFIYIMQYLLLLNNITVFELVRLI